MTRLFAIAALATALALAGCGGSTSTVDPVGGSSSSSGGSSSSSSSSSGGLSAFATEMLNAVNAERAANGVTPPLTWNADLEEAALAHTTWMNATATMSHTGEGGSSPSDRITAAGYSWNWCAENIAYGYTSVSAVMDGWMNSSGHRANILSTSARELGAARVGNYWTQNFGRQPGAAMPEPAAPTGDG